MLRNTTKSQQNSAIYSKIEDYGSSVLAALPSLSEMSVFLCVCTSDICESAFYLLTSSLPDALGFQVLAYWGRVGLGSGSIKI